MTIAAFGFAVAVACYAVASLLASAAVAMLWRLSDVRRRIANDALAILALRLFPTGIALLVSLGLVLPAEVHREPGSVAVPVGRREARLRSTRSRDKAARAEAGSAALRLRSRTRIALPLPRPSKRSPLKKPSLTVCARR